MNSILRRFRLALVPVLITLVCSASSANASSYTIAPLTKNFGNTTVGTTSLSSSFTVTNTGSTAVTVTAYDVAPSQFLFFAGWAPKTLLAGQKTTYDVKFAPTAGQVYNGTLTIYVDGVPNIVNLTGTGKTTKAKATLSVTALDFGSNPAGQTSLAQNVTVTNTGTATFLLKTITIDPPYAVTGFN
jgi:hypothetical protein